MAKRTKNYRWVRAAASIGGEGFYDVAILPDGSLHNPHGYDEDAVRLSITEVEAIGKERRSAAAKKAAETRRRRREREVYAVARKILSGANLPPSARCNLCGRVMTDEESQARAIGPECWQGVLNAIEDVKANG